MNLKRHVTELRVLRQGLISHGGEMNKNSLPIELTEFQIGVIAYALSYTSMAETVAGFPDYQKMLDHIGNTANAVATSLEKSDPDADWDGMCEEAESWLNRLLNAENN